MDPSGSKVNLLLECQYWARPDVPAPPDDGPNKYANYGTNVHYLTECMSTGEEPDPTRITVVDYELEQARRDANALYIWQRDRISGDKHYEPKVAYNKMDGSARLLLSTTPRDYSECTDDEFPGTADLIAVRPDSLTVVDYKTGTTPWETYRNQLHFLGLCAGKIFNRSRIHLVVLKVANGQCYPSGWMLDAEPFELRLKAALNTPNPQPVPGAHCIGMYCPIVASCPATCNKIANATGIKLPPLSGIPANQAEFQAMYDLVMLLTKSKYGLTTGLRKYADEHGGVPLANGKIYKRDKNGKYREMKNAGNE